LISSKNSASEEERERGKKGEGNFNKGKRKWGNS
jgi:hypothetical protein